MVTAETAYNALLVGQGVGVAVFAALLLRELRKPEDALVSFQLKPDATVRDFKLLLVFSTCQLIAYVLTLTGGILVRDAIIMSGALLSVATAYIGVYVYYRWWRRFR